MSSSLLTNGRLDSYPNEIGITLVAFCHLCLEKLDSHYVTQPTAPLPLLCWAIALMCSAHSEKSGQNILSI